MWWEDLQNFLLVGRHLPQWPGLRALRHLIFNIPPPDEDDETVGTAPGTLSYVPTAGKNRVALLTVLSSALFARLARTHNRQIIENAITSARKALSLSPPTDDRDAALLYSLAELLLCRFELIGRPADVQEALSLHRKVLLFHPPGHTGRYISVLSLARALHVHFCHIGDPKDLTDSIDSGREALSLFDPSRHSRDRPTLLATLAAPLLSSFKQTSLSTQLDQCIEYARAAVSCCSPESPARPMLLDVLSQSLLSRYEHLGESGDLEEAIGHAQEAASLCSAGHPDCPRALGTVAAGLLARSKCTGRLDDMAQSVSLSHKALSHCSPSMPIRLVLLDTLVSALIISFTHEGRQEDLEKSIEYGNKALALSPQGRPDRPHSLVNLAVAKWTRFVFASRREDMEDSVASLRQAIELPVKSRATIRAVALGRLADALRYRFMTYGAPEDLEESIILGKEALSACDPHAPSRAMVLNSLASSFGQRFGYAGEDEDFNLSMEYIRECHASFTAESLTSLDLFVGPTLFLDVVLTGRQGVPYPSIDLVRNVLDASSPRNLHRPSLLGILALSSFLQYQESNNREHFETFFTFTQEALSLCSPFAVAFPNLLFNSAEALETWFRRSGESGALAQCIESIHAALLLCSYAHPHRQHTILEHLWESLKRIFEQTGDLEVLNKSISYLQDAVAHCPSTSPIHPALIRNVAIAFRERSIHTKQVNDVDRSLGYFRQALSLYPAPHPVGVLMLSELGASLRQRFEMTGVQADLEKSVESFEEALSHGISVPSLHTSLLFGLVSNLRERYAKITRNIEDIQKSLEYGQRYLSLCPLGHPDHDEALVDLAHTLRTRHLIDGDPEDLEQCISYLEMALASLLREASLPPSGFVTSVNTMSALASALAQRFSATGRHDDLNRSIDLNYKALALCPIGHPDRSRVINSLAHSLNKRYGVNDDLGDLENAIIYLREDLETNSDSAGLFSRHSTITALAGALHLHFRLTHQPDDLRDSIKYGYEALSLCPPGHSGREAFLFILSSSLGERFNLMKQLEDLNCCILFLREAISADQDHKFPYRVGLLKALTEALCIRANESHWDAQAEARAEDLKECTRYIEEALHLCPPGHPDRSEVLVRFSQYHQCQYEQTKKSEDMQKAIDYLREALSLSSADQSSSSLHLVNSLGRALIGRYRALQTVEDLDECIDRGRRMLSLCPLEPSDPEHFNLLFNLAASSSARYSKTGNKEDISNAILYAKEGALLESTVYRLTQLDSAILWAHLAHENSHPSALEAYRRSLELLQRDLAIAPTLEMQHEVVRDEQSLPLDAAAYAINQGNLELAVEILEQGRALLWSQVRRLRTPLDQLSADERLRPLRDTFLEKSRALEAVSIAASPLISVSAVGKRSDSYGHMLETKRCLSAELEEVIDQIRAKIPDFLKPPSYDRLRAASVEGPVIIVNKSRFRSDALILGPGEKLSCVELIDTFSEQAVELVNNLLNARRALDTAPKRYDRVLRRTLEELADLVVGPVVERLKELGVKEGSRIWWCPTSAVSILPLHAAGPIAMPEPRSSKGKIYLPDLYIPSYTPTLTALIESRAAGSGRRIEHEGLLGVVLLDKALKAVGKEVEVLRTHFADSDLTLAIESHCNREAVTAGLAERPWVHFSCHGTLRSGEPLNSAFILSGGERITLLDIIKADLHRENAELAVLSACHTAEWTPNSATDEALHLAAAMQFSGFKSVVGTMWQLQDEDGPTFAKAFYDAMFAERRNKDMPQGSEVGFRRAARALCSATKEMRQSRANLERWVNFVHIGA